VNLADALAYVESLDILGMRFGLARMEHLLAELGDPHRAQPAIHVVGTNGKSSTTRLLAAMLAAEGLRTAAYLSPHIVGWTERLMIDGETVRDAVFADAVTRVRDVVANCGYAGDDAVTQFEVLTAAAFVAVADADVEVFVVEAGLGGRFDATNVLDGGAVTVLTNISREHTELLGETETEIAGEKLAVAPDGSDRLVIGRLDAAAGGAVDAVMATHRLSGWRLGHEIHVHEEGGRCRITVDGTVYPGLRVGATGRFQRDNLAVALGAAQRFLGHPLDAAAVRGAAARVRVPGRLEVFPGAPDVAIDGAHNPAGMRALADSLTEVFGVRRPVALVSVLDDKDLGAMLEAIVPRCAAVVATRSSHRRAADPAAVAAAAGELGATAEVVADPAAALATAIATAGPAGAVLVCGSLYLLGDVRPVLIAARPAGPPQT
jgi:dihydrofolate synthase / folylpolyglutamate synthase